MAKQMLVFVLSLFEPISIPSFLFLSVVENPLKYLYLHMYSLFFVIFTLYSTIFNESKNVIPFKITIMIANDAFKFY